MTELLPMALILALSGGIAGVLAGLLGIGGGIIMVPALYFALGAIGAPQEFLMHMAVGTSLAVIIPTGASSARSHYRRGAVDVERAKDWGSMIFLGALAGAGIARLLDSVALTLFFATVAAILGLRMMLIRSAPETKNAAPGFLIRRVIPFVIGAVSSLMGIGGATFTVPTLTHTGFQIHRAIGTASLVGLFIAVPASIGYAVTGLGIEGRPEYSVGFIHLPALLVAAPVASLLAPIGARLSHALNQKVLGIIFGSFLIFTAIRLAADAI